jgi:peptide/nickel transport system permease protein
MTEAAVDVLVPATAAAAPSARPRWVRRLLANHSVVAGALILLVFVLAALLAGVLSTHNPTRLAPASRLLPPSARHILGTDEFGRDIWSLVLYGSRISLLVGVTTMLLTSIGGIVVGLVAGYSRRLDSVVMRVMDGLMAFPDVLLAIGLMAVLGPRVSNVIVALVVVYTPRMARVVRSVALVTGETVYVDAARALGASEARLLWRHVLPNCLSPAVVQATFTFALAVLTEAALGFLGVGAPPQLASWGTIISEGRLLVREAPWLTIVPGLAIVVTVVGLNLTGDGLRDYLDPRQPAS